MIIVDTNVVAELMRPDPAAVVITWLRGVSERLATTAVTVAEIEYGIERLPKGRRRTLLKSTAGELFSNFANQILSFDAEAALQYAAIVAECDRLGCPMSGFDAQIAGICRVHEATLATRNGKDFRHAGVGVIDPWSFA